MPKLEKGKSVRVSRHIKPSIPTDVDEYWRKPPIRDSKRLKRTLGLSRRGEGRVFKDQNGNTIVEVPSRYFNQIVSGDLDQKEVAETLEKSGIELWEVQDIKKVETHGTGIPDVSGSGGQVYLQNALTRNRVPFDFLSRAGTPPDPRQPHEFYGLIDIPKYEKRVKGSKEYLEE